MMAAFLGVISYLELLLHTRKYGSCRELEPTSTSAIFNDVPWVEYLPFIKCGNFIQKQNHFEFCARTILIGGKNDRESMSQTYVCTFTLFVSQIRTHKFKYLIATVLVFIFVKWWVTRAPSHRFCRESRYGFRHFSNWHFQFCTFRTLSNLVLHGKSRIKRIVRRSWLTYWRSQCNGINAMVDGLGHQSSQIECEAI